MPTSNLYRFEDGSSFFSATGRLVRTVAEEIFSIYMMERDEVEREEIFSLIATMALVLS
jgi:hypothetical protein